MVDEGIPNPPVEVIRPGEQYNRKIIETHMYSYMSETQAKAMIDVSKYTYAVPARQETLRFITVVVLIAAVLFFLLPVFVSRNPDARTIGAVIVASLALLGAKPVIDAIGKAVKGS